MFASFPPELFKALAEEPLTGNFHHYGVTEQVRDSTSVTDRSIYILSHVQRFNPNSVFFRSLLEMRN